MREGNRKASVVNNNDTKHSGGDKRTDRRPKPENHHKAMKKTEIKSETPRALLESGIVRSNSNTVVDPSEVYEEVVIHYMDDLYKSVDVVTDAKSHEGIDKENGGKGEVQSSDPEREVSQEEEEFDSETCKDSASSQGETHTAKDNRTEEASRVPKKQSESSPRTRRTSSDHQDTKKLQFNSDKKSQKPNKASERPAKVHDMKLNNVNVRPKASLESSEVSDDKAIQDFREIDVLDEAPKSAQSIGTDDETAVAGRDCLAKVNGDQKMEEMELRIEKLEEELREIAALEISLYSVVPEHGSSANKVHTPARRLSRLYLHACKHWTQDRRASVARNSVSGLVLIAKSCGNDVPRLTYWWSNTIVLREIISQAFGSSHHSSMIARAFESNGDGKRSKLSPSLQCNGNNGYKHVKKLGFMQHVDDWQETGTFIDALEKVESWIFSRIIESVWWQVFTPFMQSPIEYTVKNPVRLMGPPLGDQKQGSFSIGLWKSAFQDAFQRLCPVRSGGHDCGCLPVLARMVMEKCVNRLDVAMFNAILRESASQIPTDPVSDPIVDSKVLPIPAGELSFGSGAQLKNSIGTWSRWLTDMLIMHDVDSLREDKINAFDDARKDLDAESKLFYLLNVLSDLLMLPKDMLMDRAIRKEVCPSFGLPLITRILCNFTPDEFCPDPVPGIVLEALNSESLLERRQPDDTLLTSSPCSAAPIIYGPPSLTDVAEKVADVGGPVGLARNPSTVQSRGYSSDEELDDLESPLTFVLENLPSLPSPETGINREAGRDKGMPTRYKLLREVWSA